MQKQTPFEDFKSYHHQNLHIYEHFERLALVAAQHRERFSARTIIHVLRWDTMVSGVGEFKISDHVSPYYARMFMRRYPNNREFFSTKRILNLWEAMDLDELADNYPKARV